MLKTKLQQLKKSNRDVFIENHEDRYLLQQMFAYLWRKNLNAYDAECLRRDLLGMAQEAQQRQQPLRELIGDDRAFCDELLASCNKGRMSNTIFAGLSLCCMLTVYFCIISLNLHARPLVVTITADYIFGALFMWSAYYLLWFRIIPLPYSFYNHTLKLLALAFVSWYLLFRTILFHSQLYREYILGKVLLSFPTPANLVFLAALWLGYVGFAYAADTLAYRQSSFRR